LREKYTCGLFILFLADLLVSHSPVSGLRGDLHMGPHQVEAPARLRKKEEETPEAAWVGDLSWAAQQLLREREPL
jgi:hypothetical protein